MMESKEIKLCDLRSRRKGLGVEKIEEEGITIPSSAMALLRKWIVRCYDEDEAQRVVREFHMSRPWEPSECILLAEVIY